MANEAWAAVIIVAMVLFGVLDITGAIDWKSGGNFWAVYNPVIFPLLIIIVIIGGAAIVIKVLR